MIHATMIISILSLLATMAGEATRGRQKGHRYGYEYDEFKNLVDPYLIISTGFIHTIILSLFSSRTKVHKSRKQKVITTISLFFLLFFLSFSVLRCPSFYFKRRSVVIFFSKGHRRFSTNENLVLEFRNNKVGGEVEAGKGMEKFNKHRKSVLENRRNF